MINSRIATGDITCYMGLSWIILSLAIDFAFNIIQPYSSALGTGSPGCFTPNVTCSGHCRDTNGPQVPGDGCSPFYWDPRSGCSRARESVSLACSTVSVGTSLYDLWVRGNCMSSNQCHLFKSWNPMTSSTCPQLKNWESSKLKTEQNSLLV